MLSQSVKCRPVPRCWHDVQRSTTRNAFSARLCRSTCSHDRCSHDRWPASTSPSPASFRSGSRRRSCRSSLAGRLPSGGVRRPSGRPRSRPAGRAGRVRGYGRRVTDQPPSPTSALSTRTPSTTGATAQQRRPSSVPSPGTALHARRPSPCAVRLRQVKVRRRTAERHERRRALTVRTSHQWTQLWYAAILYCRTGIFPLDLSSGISHWINGGPAKDFLVGVRSRPKNDLWVNFNFSFKRMHVNDVYRLNNCSSM